MTKKVKYPVLVVDDEEDLRDLIELTLLKMDLEVETASGVMAARKKLANNAYSLVLTDMRMPDGTGLDVVEFINDKGLDVPIAVVTAYGNADNAVEALKRGAFDYIQKPITLAQLRTLVKSAIKVEESETPEEKETIVPPKKPVSADGESPRRTALSTPRYGDIDFDFSLMEDGKEKSELLNRIYISNNKKRNLEPPNKIDFNKKIDIKEKKAEKDFSLLDEKSPVFEKKVVEDKKIIPPSEPVEKIKKEEVVSDSMPRLLGDSASMLEVKEIIKKLSKTLVPVYISGESGTGKEQAARSIHELSNRKEKAFVPVNCGAIPENLMESEFFGYKKGSFTGADSDKDGFFQYANGGTIFLDEVADLPLTMQVKLLRVIQERMVRKIGDNKETAVDVRILCATHKNLEKEVEEGRFRQDLYYRLNVITLRMPPLRELKDDLPKLIRRLLQKFSGSVPIQLLPDAFKTLLNYDYPGNFRELENILERAVALSTNNSIKDDDLQLRAVSKLPSSDLEEISTVAADSGSGVVAEIESLMKGTLTLQDLLDNYEKEILMKALVLSKYNRTQAAKLLGISFRSIRYRLERLNIE